MVGQQLCAKNVKNTEACVRVSVFVDERKNRTRSEKSAQAAKKRASERAKNGGNGEGETTSLSLPSPHAVFRTFFLSFFPTFLEPGTG